jgi:DNA polymerase III gamma/tau subunit
LILSAKYGLIESTKIISPYDTKMTLRLAKEIKVESTYNLLKFIKHNNYYEIFVELGKIYKEGIDFEDLIGIRMHNLKNWLISEKIDVDLPETKKDIN